MSPDVMFAFRKVMVAVFLLVALVAGAFAASDWLTGSTDEKLKTLAGIQPGLGTVMIEYSNRYTDIYYAAKSGNWPLAAYQLKETLEIQEGNGCHAALGFAYINYQLPSSALSPLSMKP